MYSTQSITEAIQKHLPGAEVIVNNPRNDNKHFDASVNASQFEGKNLVEQHRMVYAALEKEFKEGMHALALKTSIKK